VAGREKGSALNFKIALAKAADSIRRDGLLATFRKAFVHLTYGRAGDDDFDREYGTDTGGLVPLWKVTVNSVNSRFGTPYRATAQDELVDALRFLGEELRDFTFIDLGCGKARMLLVAARLGFASVIGVEFADELAAIARANIAKMKIANATIVFGDVAEYEVPASDLVVYLYNPFSIEIMRKVVAKLEAHRRDFPAKKLYVIYKGPVCAPAIDESAFFRNLGLVPDHGDILVWKAQGGFVPSRNA
jgi:SAM-dependent methyltransferase